MKMFNTKRNFYEILNASANATFDELKSNYKHLILQCHPDKLHQQQQAREYESADKLENDLNSREEEFVAITEAWNCLKDPSKRKQYDAELLLNKFHTHNNIYAHIQLKEMKKCLSTDVDVEFELVNEDGENEDNKDTNAAAETPSYFYTYDCRCGGQYIVDESAEQYCRRVNSTGTDTTVGAGGDVDDDADITQNNNNNSPNKTTAAAHNSNDGVHGGGGVGIEGVGGFREDKDAEGDSDNDSGELIVECSECSLVIILNG